MQYLFTDSVTLPELARKVVNPLLTIEERNAALIELKDRLPELDGVSWTQLDKFEQAAIMVALR